MYIDDLSDIEALVAAGYGASIHVKSALRAHPDIAVRELSGAPRVRARLAWRGASPASDTLKALASLLQMTSSETNGVF